MKVKAIKWANFLSDSNDKFHAEDLVGVSWFATKGAWIGFEKSIFLMYLGFPIEIVTDFADFTDPESLGIWYNIINSYVVISPLNTIIDMWRQNTLGILLSDFLKHTLKE